MTEPAWSSLLDLSSPCPPLLEAGEGCWATRLHLRQSDAPTSSYGRSERSSVKQRQAGSAPRGDGDVLSLLAAFDRARTNRERLHIIAETQRLAIAAENSVFAKWSPGWKAAICADTRSLRKVAADYGISHTKVAQIREAANREADAAAVNELGDVEPITDHCSHGHNAVRRGMVRPAWPMKGQRMTITLTPAQIADGFEVRTEPREVVLRRSPDGRTMTFYRVGEDGILVHRGDTVWTGAPGDE